MEKGKLGKARNPLFYGPLKFELKIELLIQLLKMFCEISRKTKGVFFLIYAFFFFLFSPGCFFLYVRDKEGLFKRHPRGIQKFSKTCI